MSADSEEAAAPPTPHPALPPQGGKENSGTGRQVPSPLEGEGQGGGDATGVTDERLPVTVVTGFLGSGKTTLINGLLKHLDMAETAVLVNEFGEIGLDHLLVEAIDETTVLIGAGCLCCTVREDMVAALDDLLARREAGTVPAFRRVLLETTGLADPAPILHTLLAESGIAARCRIDGIVTTVDAQHGAAGLDRHDESLRQAAVADRLVLTKTDLAAAADVTALRARLCALNGGATQLTAPVAPADLFGADTLADAAHVARWLGHDPAHRHDSAVGSLSLTASEPLRVDRVVAWIENLLLDHGDRLLRLKGILDLQGSAVPVAVHGVQHVFHPLQKLAAWPPGLRSSRLVLIGRDLPGEAIAQSFAALACQHR